MSDTIPSDNNDALQACQNGGMGSKCTGPQPGKTNSKKSSKQTKFAPSLVPILETPPREHFPIFLGVGIAVSILALATVFILLLFSHRTKTPRPTGPQPASRAMTTPAMVSKPPQGQGAGR